MSHETAPPQLALSSRPAGWLLTATVLSSGMAFLDCTVVPVVLPAVTGDLGGGISVQQWVLNGYLLTLSALLLLGGALGDRYGRRRVFVTGLALFAVASAGCGLAWSPESLTAARLAQGVGGALLIPGSLALISSSLRPADRGRAVGRWAGLSGVAGALGPVLGGGLADVASWRLVFLVNLPVAVVAAWITLRHVPERRHRPEAGLDLPGASTIMVGLAGTTYALIEVPDRGWSPVTVTAALLGVAGLAALPLVERRAPAPLLPLHLFRSAQFTGANVATFTLEGSVAGAFFLLALQLQQTLGYSALAAGLALFPITALMVLFSARVGALSQRIGPRLPMTVGPLLCAAGLALLARVVPGAGYATVVLPAVLLFAVGLTLTVAPLTSAVLAAAPEPYAGTAAGTNNTVAWVAGLVAVAVLPPATGIHATEGASLGPGYGRAMLVAAAACALGGVVAFATVHRTGRVRPQPVPTLTHPCPDQAGTPAPGDRSTTR